MTDGAVRVTSHAVRGLAEGPLWLWLVEDGVRARMVDVPGLLRALARLGEADSGREAETGDRPP